MIVVVEGPSAAGKTTWCRRHFPAQTVWEAPAGAAPSREDDPEQAARYWLQRNEQRWAAALALEMERGLAVCDTDPFKLHYAWSLLQVGELSRSAWEVEARRHRESFAAGRLGLADLLLVSIPESSALASRREGDRSRTRRHFALHARLAEPLRSWYRAIEMLDAERVVWEHPPAGLPRERLALGSRARPTDAGAIDAILEQLAPPGG